MSPRASAALLLMVLVLSPAVAAQSLSVRSRDLHDGARVPLAQVYDRDGCGGGNRSPALSWSGAPPGTHSFAVTLFDPDAPTGHGWWHWVVYDLPAGTATLATGAAAGSLPAGARQARNDYGGVGYDGPCPPPGPAHRYRLTVYALDVAHLHPNGDSAVQVVRALRQHALASASLTALYAR